MSLTEIKASGGYRYQQLQIGGPDMSNKPTQGARVELLVSAFILAGAICLIWEILPTIITAWPS
jgi:hypothetical protein